MAEADAAGPVGAGAPTDAQFDIAIELVNARAEITRLTENRDQLAAVVGSATDWLDDRAFPGADDDLLREILERHTPASILDQLVAASKAAGLEELAADIEETGFGQVTPAGLREAAAEHRNTVEGAAVTGG